MCLCLCLEGGSRVFTVAMSVRLCEIASLLYLANHALLLCCLLSSLTPYPCLPRCYWLVLAVVAYRETCIRPSLPWDRCLDVSSAVPTQRHGHRPACPGPPPRRDCHRDAHPAGLVATTRQTCKTSRPTEQHQHTQATATHNQRCKSSSSSSKTRRRGT